MQVPNARKVRLGLAARDQSSLSMDQVGPGKDVGKGRASQGVFS